MQVSVGIKPGLRVCPLTTKPRPLVMGLQKIRLDIGHISFVYASVRCSGAVDWVTGRESSH